MFARPICRYLLTLLLLGRVGVATAGSPSKHAAVLTQDGKPYTGIVLEKYPDGSVYRETNYRDGLKHGPEKEYSLAHTLTALWMYQNDKKQGTQQGWFAEGQRKFLYHYQNGLLEGLQTEWHLNGGVFRQQVFEHGTETDRKILFQTGEVHSNVKKRDGRTYGRDGGELCFDKKKDGQK